MGTHRLIPHPASLPQGIKAVDVRLFDAADGRIGLRYMVNGMGALKLPSFAGVGRADRLWESTCFELFVRDPDGAGYAEYNFAPSQRWAAYRFDGYRSGMREGDVLREPEIVPERGDELYVQTVWLDGGELARTPAIGLSAVIEEISGRKSYWALEHPGDEPDFHDPACFALTPG